MHRNAWSQIHQHPSRAATLISVGQWIIPSGSLTKLWTITIFTQKNRHVDQLIYKRAMASRWFPVSPGIRIAMNGLDTGPSSLQTKPFKHQIMFYTIIGCYKSQCILNKHSYNYQGVKHFLTSTSTTFSTSCALVRHLGPPGSIETSIVHNSRVCTWKPGHTGTGSQKIGTFGDLIEMCEYDWTCLSLWNLYCIILYIRPCAILRHLPLLQQSQPSYAS